MGLLLAGEPIPMIAEAFRSSGITWWSLPDWKTEKDEERTWRFVDGFRRVNALEPWDVVSFNFCQPLSVIMACTWSMVIDRRRFARVWHQHQGVPSPRGVKKHVSTLRLLGPFMDALVATTEFGTRYYKEHRCPLGKIRVIRSGRPIPESQSRAGLRTDLRLAESSRLLVSVASLIHRKGLDVLLTAVSGLFKQYPYWHLAIAGAGPLREDLKEQARRLGIEEQVHFLGLSNDVMGILADCDAFVLPSRNEDLPCAIMEAMASELPVVATCVGGVSELVVHNVTGLLVLPDDAAALRSALEVIMTDEKLAREFGRNGKERVQNVFSFDGAVEGHLDLFRELSR